MKTIIAFWFSLLFLAQSFAPNGDLCCELKKLPNLVSHYLNHNAFDGDSFVQFLAEDFFNEGHDLAGKHDTQEHEDMPFHGNHQCTHAPVFIPTETFFELKDESTEQALLFHPLEIQFSSNFTASLFQPPRA